MYKKSITIHGIESQLNDKIREKSQEYGMSQNKTVKKILKDSLMTDPKEIKRKHFDKFFGVWTKDEAKAFEDSIKDFEITDPEDWD